MTYKKLVKELDEHTKDTDGATIIDGLIIEHGQAVAFDALSYMADFFGSRMYNEMRYWREGRERPTQKAICKIAEALKRIYPDHVARLDYLINA